MPLYQIHILASDDFDRLPYRRSREAFGVADPQAHQAYVRYTALPALDRSLVQHEFNHLIEQFPTDEEDGVRYAIPGAGKLASLAGSLGRGLMGGAQTAGRAFAQAPQAIGRGLPALNPLQTGTALAAPATPVARAQFGSTLRPPMGTALPTTFRRATLFQPGMTAGRVRQLFGDRQPTQNTSALGFFQHPLTQLGAGALLTGIGLHKGYPQAPSLPPEFLDLQKSLMAGGALGPLAELGQSALREQLQTPFAPLGAEEEAAITRTYDRSEQQELDEVRDLYRNLRPGTDPSTDDTFRRDVEEVHRKYAQGRADALALGRRNLRGEFNQQRLQQIQLALGASQQQMSQLVSLAQLPVYLIAQQLQIDLAKAQEFKNTFLTLGQGLLESGLGRQQPLSLFSLG